MKINRIIISAILIASTATNTSAQVLDLSNMYPAEVVDVKNVWKYYSFRQPSSPTTYALSRKGQLRIELSPHIRLNNMPDSIFMLDVGDGRTMAKYCYRDKFPINCAGSRINISYTPWEHITLGAAFLFTQTFQHIGHVVAQFSDDDNIAGEFDVNNLFRHQIYSSTFMSGELSGAYHSVITNFMAYEVRTAMSIGSGKQRYNDTYSCNTGDYSYFGENIKYISSVYDDYFKYTMFNHSFVGGLSFFTPRRTLQASLLVDVGYTTYFNKQLERPFYSRQLYDQVIDPFNRNPWDLYCAPWFMLSINTPAVFSIRFHYGFEVSKQHRRYDGAPLRSTAGVTLSWRLTNARMLPKE